MTCIPKRIIIVENDPDTRFLLTKVFQDPCIEVLQFDTAMPILNGNCKAPDLFLVDEELPSVNGLSLCEHLRSEEQTKDVPVVMISVRAIAKKAKRGGVDEFVRKPLAAGRIRKAVGKYLYAKKHLKKI